MPATLRRYLPFDWAVSVYLGGMGLAVAVWGANTGHRWSIVFLHAALIIGVFVVVGGLGETRSRAGRFIRFLYLPMALTFLYEETSWFLRLFHEGWFDWQLIALEEAVFGVLPNVWLEAGRSLWLDEWMMFGYFSYYPLVALPPLIWYVQGRHRELARLLLGESLAFFISYVGFALFPVQGPRFELAGQFAQPLRGVVFAPLVNWIMDVASIHGGCMPSSHVAVALVCLVFLFRYQRRWGIAVLPVVVTLWVGTVYGRFHYLSDVVVGLLIGGLASVIAWRSPGDRWMSRAVPQHQDHNVFPAPALHVHPPAGGSGIRG